MKIEQEKKEKGKELWEIDAAKNRGLDKSRDTFKSYDHMDSWMWSPPLKKNTKVRQYKGGLFWRTQVYQIECVLKQTTLFNIDREKIVEVDGGGLTLN